MTPARQQRKSATPPSLLRRWARPAVCRLGLAVALALALLCFPRVDAATTERVVTDVMTGLAVHGIDPVAYFTDGTPLYGRPDQEARYAGVIWRFRNEGNKAAFIADPDIYMPRYGGYDPIGIGRAVAVPGNPLLWAMVGERVYLFYNEEARARFMANPNEAILHADNKWPTVVSGLVP